MGTRGAIRRRGDCGDVLVATADEFEQQVGMAVGIGEVSDFVDQKECRRGVVP